MDEKSPNNKQNSQEFKGFFKTNCDYCRESGWSDNMYNCSRCGNTYCYNCVIQRDNPDGTFTTYCRCGAVVG